MSYKYYILYCLVVAVFAGCSAEKTNVVATTYHNTTAHYNAYFYANERLTEVENHVMGNMENNFNKILTIYPPIDTSLATTMKTQLDDVIKKASIAIQRHPNSKWKDLCYALVGIARFYNLEYADAVETFKYVNAKGEDDNAKHLGLVYLMRTFIEFKEFNNAVAVSDFLAKESLEKDNLRLLYLTRAHLHHLQEDYDKMVQNLVLAAPLITKNQDRARVYFIIGQIYQQLNFEAEAYNNYGLCLKNNPSYELSFYARLNRAQVVELTAEDDLKKVRKYFTKMLKDVKNSDFKDKIYYEMGQFEVKHGNLDQAIDYYKSSAQVSTNNRRQKGYSFLRLGQIFYNQKKEYELAKAYYDSVVATLPQDDELYADIAARQKILENFVTQITTIQDQDSLLALANLDSTSLNRVLDNYIAQQEKLAEEKEKKEKEAAKRAKRVSNNRLNNQGDEFGAFDNNQNGATWYFYNTSALGQGSTEFKRIWGNRPLEDNWRRANKQNAAPGVADAGTDTGDEPASEGKEQKPADGKEEPQTKKPAFDKKQLMQTLPLTAEAKEVALGKIEEAYYKLGNIYYFDLLEKENAIETFDTMIIRFPESEYVPEVLYELYLLYKDKGDPTYEKYKNELITNHPKSIYAKIIINPNYKEETNAATAKLQAMYDEAYALFMKDRFKESDSLLQIGLDTYPENVFRDNLELLQIMVKAKANENLYEYRFRLDTFVANNPESELLDFAKTLKKSAVDFQKNLDERKSKRYIEDFDQKHTFVLVYRKEKEAQAKIAVNIDNFLAQHYSDSSYTTGSLTLDDNHAMVIIKEFPTKAQAELFHKFFNGAESPTKEIQTTIFYNFVITEDNFNIFYRFRDFQSYLTFFNKHYNKENG